MSDLVPTGNLPEKADSLPDPPKAFRKATELIRNVIGDMSVLVANNPDDLEGQAALMVIIERLRSDMAAVNDEIKSNLHRLSPKYRFEVEGVGTFERTKSGSTPVWDDKAALNKLLELCEGEFGPFLDLLQEAASLKWRSTPFKDRDIDVYDEDNPLAERRPGRPSVRLVGGGIKK